MRNGTLYGARLGKAYAIQKHAAPKPRTPEPDDPLRRLAIGVLGVVCGDDVAERAVDRALTTLVDWNDVRVSSAFELNQALGNTIPQGIRQCDRLIAALQAVFDLENKLSLERLRSVGRREARHYLEQLKGVDEYAAASVLLWSLGAHAIPVGDRLLSALRDADLVHPTATRAEVQAFLERHVSAAEAQEFCLIMRSFKPPKRPQGRAAVKKKTATR